MANSPRMLIFKRAQVLRKSLYGAQRKRDLKGVPKHLHAQIKTRLPFNAGELGDWLERASLHEACVVWRCPYTNEILALAGITIDHVIPLSEGGQTNLSNFVATSPRANRMKGNMSVEEFRRLRYMVDGFSHSAAQNIYNRLAQPPHAKMNEFRKAGRK